MIISYNQLIYVESRYITAIFWVNLMEPIAPGAVFVQRAAAAVSGVHGEFSGDVHREVQMFSMCF